MTNLVESKKFAAEHKIEGLTEPSIKSVMAKEAGYTLDKAQQFLAFQQRINKDLLQHPVIQNNEYCKWFQQGKMTEDKLRYFLIQFSVFSNLFLIAQLKKTINADSIEGMRASKEILANEIGVIFNSDKKPDKKISTEFAGDADIVALEGSIEGGAFRFRAAHFEWLLHMAEKLGLGFNDVGKRAHGAQSTLFFCDELERLYGSEDYMISQASSYAVENWAAAGFWFQLVDGFTIYNEKSGANLPLGFFTWHAKIEAQHAAHTQEELEELYFERDIDENKFIQYGNEMLQGVSVFWQGLNEQRLGLA